MAAEPAIASAKLQFTVSGEPTRIATLAPNLLSIDAMPDRESFLAITPESVGPGSLTIVQNWRAALEGKR